MSFRAYCLRCGKKVTVAPANLTNDEFWAAMNANEAIEVMHVLDGSDHRWMLTEEDKKHLRNAKARGFI